jgi:hypothetical protein
MLHVWPVKKSGLKLSIQLHMNIMPCTHAHVHTCTRAHMHTFTPAHVHTCTCSHMHMFTHAHIHTCTHANMQTCKHAHIHTCTHAHSYSLLEATSSPTAKDFNALLIHHSLKEYKTLIILEMTGSPNNKMYSYK